MILRKIGIAALPVNAHAVSFFNTSQSFAFLYSRCGAVAALCVRGTESRWAGPARARACAQMRPCPTRSPIRPGARTSTRSYLRNSSWPALAQKKKLGIGYHVLISTHPLRVRPTEVQTRRRLDTSPGASCWIRVSLAWIHGGQEHSKGALLRFEFSAGDRLFTRTAWKDNLHTVRVASCCERCIDMK